MPIQRQRIDVQKACAETIFYSRVEALYIVLQ